ncbi:membrane protein [Bacillus coahuilensis p1.1.43]|uniref:Membrane protein n=1 Tax=Bacillus coahuilensis p1.1.43 TaxID=1150625 RepID=A0A147K7U6_9BACI|nr:hypothetical protein [Bacillus coahuilensis]KUP06202.1 membrane protein [Bacillus coahuilensis p1.1.43]
MYWETLPQFVWVLFYLFLLSTIGLSIWNLRSKKRYKLALFTIVVTILIPIVGILNSMSRYEGMNELEYLISKLLEGEIWSLLVIIGLLYILVYWCMILFKKKR